MWAGPRPQRVSSSRSGRQRRVSRILKLREWDVIFQELPLLLRYDLKQGASKMTAYGVFDADHFKTQYRDHAAQNPP